MGFLLPCLLASTLVAAPQFEVQRVDGEPLKGQIQSLDAGQLTLVLANGSAAGAKTVLPIARIAGIVRCDQKQRAKPSDLALAVDLVDGSTLQIADYTVKDGMARLQFAGGESLSIPTESILSARLQRGSPTAMTEWASVLAKRPVADLLVTVKQGNIDYHQGVLHDIDDAHVDFEVEAEKLHVKREKVFGLQYYHSKTAEGEKPASGNSSALRVTDADGSVWAVAAATIEPESDVIRWALPGSQVHQCSLTNLVAIDLSQGKVVYLSDLKSDKEAFTPFFPLDKELGSREAMFRTRLDRNMESRPIKIQGQEFRKGLSMHTRSETTWTLPGGFNNLTATVGIDDEVRPQGSVRLVIRGDEKTLFDEKVSGVDAAKTIRVALDGVRRLTVLADFGDSNDIAGHLDLGNARLLK